MDLNPRICQLPSKVMERSELESFKLNSTATIAAAAIEHFATASIDSASKLIYLPRAVLGGGRLRIAHKTFPESSP